MASFPIIAEDLKRVFGKDVVRVVDSDRAFIVNGNTTLAIVTLEKDDIVVMSFRATIAPNDAGLMAAVIALRYQLLLEDNFEIVNGKMVVGREAAVVNGPKQKSMCDMSDEQEQLLIKQKDMPN